MAPATRTQVYLTAEQRERIDELMEREGKSLAWVVREALDRYLAGPTSDRSRVLDAAFGALPNLQVPSRSEWNRFPAATDAIDQPKRARPAAKSATGTRRPR